MRLDISKNDNSISIGVKAVPGSSRTSFEGTINGMLKIKLASPAEKGKANKELIGFLAEKLNLRKQDIKIVSGQNSPIKKIEICRCSRDSVIAAIGV